MTLRFAIEPFRAPEPLRSRFVARFGESAVAEFEAAETHELDLMLNGNPDAVQPRGLLRGGDLVRPVGPPNRLVVEGQQPRGYYLEDRVRTREELPPIYPGDEDE